NPDFEDGVQRIHTFLASRSSLVLSEAASDGLVASTGGPQIAAAGISALGGLQALSPGGLTIIEGTNLTAAEWAGGVPLPRVIGNTFVSVDGVRSPLLSTATGSMEFEVPCDIPVGDASIVVSSSGDMSGTVDMAVEAATPAIWAAVHGDGSAVLATSPVIAGETISLYATGLGALSVNLPIGAPGPTAPTAATAGLPQILLGGAPLAVTFSGLAPGYVGLYQVNASIPSAPAQGGFTGPFTLTINGQAASWQPALQ
ncbi:MAG: hypothetical protein WBL65_21705, partial [Bryobacteraceae bacterium]